MKHSAMALGLLLLACRSEPDSNAGSDAGSGPEAGAEPGKPAGPPAPEPDLNASLDDINMPAPPPEPDQPLRFVGNWAAEESLCESTAWEFTPTRLETPAGSVCRFTDVRTVPGGYDIAARCTAEAPERDDLIELRFAESAGAMLFESESIADAGLIRCGDGRG